MITPRINLLITVISIGLSLMGCDTWNMLRYRAADPDDYKILPTRTLAPSTTPFQFINGTSTAGMQKTGSLILEPKANPGAGLRALPPVTLNQFLELSNTNALLIIRNDSLLFERYYNGYDTSTIANSFSMAKSITSALAGMALKDGAIKSLEDPITDYLPELKTKKGFDAIRLVHLLQMTSGIRFNENYGLFSDVVPMYYTTDMMKYIHNLKIIDPPGTKWQYKSIDAALMSLVIARATGSSISQYATKKLWKPLGMETTAQWAIDSKEGGIEKTFCCVFATARDFARFGRLYAGKGMINSHSLIDPEFFNQSVTIDSSRGSVFDYQYQWWMPWWMGKINDPFYAHGYKGQRLVISPSKNLVIVKLSDDPEADEQHREYYMEMIRVLVHHF